MKKINVSDLQVAFLHIYEMSIEGLAEGDPLQINCMLLSQLHGLVNRQFERQGLEAMATPREIFDRFGFLSGQKDGRAQISWTNMTYGVHEGEEPPPGVSLDTIFVPEEWGRDVLSFAREGIQRVSLSSLPCSSACKNKASGCGCHDPQLIGHMAGDRTAEVTRIVRGRYRIFCPTSPVVDKTIL